MSDEYAASGYEGSLVNDSIRDDGINESVSDDETKNHPPQDNMTGGYAQKNIWSNTAQKGNNSEAKSLQGGLLDQSLSGTELKDELQDAMQGKDVAARRDYQHAQEHG